MSPRIAGLVFVFALSAAGVFWALRFATAATPAKPRGWDQSDPIGSCHKLKCSRGEPVYVAHSCICGEYPR